MPKIKFIDNRMWTQIDWHALGLTELSTKNKLWALALWINAYLSDSNIHAGFQRLSQIDDRKDDKSRTMRRLAIITEITNHAPADQFELGDRMHFDHTAEQEAAIKEISSRKQSCLIYLTASSDNFGIRGIHFSRYYILINDNDQTLVFTPTQGETIYKTNLLGTEFYDAITKNIIIRRFTIQYMKLDADRSREFGDDLMDWEGADEFGEVLFSPINADDWQHIGKAVGGDPNDDTFS